MLRRLRHHRRYLAGNGIGARNIGLIWMTEPDVAEPGLGRSNPLATYVLNLKLSNPAPAPAFASRTATAPPDSPIKRGRTSPPRTACWSRTSSPSWCPAPCSSPLLALATVAVLVGSRLAEHTRRVGLLKAAGATPGLVAAMFLAENLALALIAAAAGLVAGWLAAPLLTSPGAALVGTPGAPVAHAALVGGSRGRGARRRARLDPRPRHPRRAHQHRQRAGRRCPPAAAPGRLISISRRLPVPVLFGLRLAARRPRRALLSAASVAVTVTGIVAVLAFHATVAASLPAGLRRAGQPGRQPGRADADGDHRHAGHPGGPQRDLHRLGDGARRQARVGADARARRQPRQVSAGLAAAQVLSALPGALLGVPLGIGLFKAAAGAGPLPPPWLVAAVLGTLLVVAALATVPARIGTRRPAAEILQAETA